MKAMGLVAVSLALAACHAAPAVPGAPASLVREGQALAEAKCGGCHAIGAAGPSSHGEAPGFAMLVNEKGASAQTLSAWLRAAHNYPQEMDFYLSDREVAALADYMQSLKRDAREPSLAEMEAVAGNRR